MFLPKISCDNSLHSVIHGPWLRMDIIQQQAPGVEAKEALSAHSQSFDTSTG